ncbi:hypothetical protein OROHE_021455 [Orobanche hederae]
MDLFYCKIDSSNFIIYQYNGGRRSSDEHRWKLHLSTILTVVFGLIDHLKFLHMRRRRCQSCWRRHWRLAAM